MFCPHCGKEITTDANFCTACGNPSVAAQAPYRSPRIIRPREPRLIAGVCSGFALYYGWDIIVTRILFAVATVIVIPAGILFYIAAWIFMPDGQYALPQTTTAL